MPLLFHFLSHFIAPSLPSIKKAMPKIIHLALPFLVIAFLVIAFLEKRCFLKTFFLYFSYFVSISSFMSMNCFLLS